MSKYVWELKKVTTNTHFNMRLNYIAQLNVDFVTGFCIKMDTLYSLVLFILQQTPLSCCLTSTNWHSCYSVLGYFTLPRQCLSTIPRHCVPWDHIWKSLVVDTNFTPAMIYQHLKIKAHVTSKCHNHLTPLYSVTYQKAIIFKFHLAFSPYTSYHTGN